MLAKLRDLLARSCSRCTADLVALSGGLDSSILAYLLREKRPSAIAVIASDFVATDLTYCQTASRAFGMPLHVRYASTVEILGAAEETVRILRNFNDIEIRNSVVMYLAVKWASQNGFSGIITGDGADELFAGYDFLLDKPHDILERELERLRTIMHFPTCKIGKSLGIAIESPFLDDAILEFAGSTPPELKVGKKDGKTHGKWILRKAFESVIPEQIAWRSKSPMQDGAGTARLTWLFDSVISDESFEQKKTDIQKEDGITIRTKESMHYYEIFKKNYGAPAKKRSGRLCRYCGHGLAESRFCRMCGAFPA